MKKVVFLAVAAALTIPSSGLAGKSGEKSKEPAAREEPKAKALAPPPSDEPAPEAATAKERKWRADIDKEVTAHEDDAKRLVKNCGQDIPFNMDWKGFKMAEWDGINLASFCIGDLPSRLAENCQEPEYKKEIVKVKKVACHYSPCADLPLSNPAVKDSGPGFKFVLAKDRSRMDVYFCEKSSTWADLHVGRWLRENL